MNPQYTPCSNGVFKICMQSAAEPARPPHSCHKPPKITAVAMAGIRDLAGGTAEGDLSLWSCRRPIT